MKVVEESEQAGAHQAGLPHYRRLCHVDAKMRCIWNEPLPRGALRLPLFPIKVD